jgi:hypothetical protein
MNWEAIGAFAELLGALGVFGSLLYLAIQIRQNTKALRGTTIDAVTTHQRDELRWAAELAPTFAKADRSPDSMTPDEWGQVRAWITAAMTTRQNSYFQYRQELLDEEIWKSNQQIIKRYFQMGNWVDKWWQYSQKHQVFSKGFIDMVNELAAQLDDQPDTAKDRLFDAL